MMTGMNALFSTLLRQQHLTRLGLPTSTLVLHTVSFFCLVVSFAHTYRIVKRCSLWFIIELFSVGRQIVLYYLKVITPSILAFFFTAEYSSSTHGANGAFLSQLPLIKPRRTIKAALFDLINLKYDATIDNGGSNNHLHCYQEGVYTTRRRLEESLHHVVGTRE